MAVPGESPYTLTWKTFTPTSSFPFTGNNPQSCEVKSGYAGSSNGAITAISQISLPNGKSYQFQYDTVTGLLSKLIYPNGGYVRYTWTMTSSPFDGFAFYQPDVNGGFISCSVQYDSFVLQKRFVSFDGTHEVQEQDFGYVVTWNGNNIPFTQRQTTVTTKDLIRGTNSQTVYTYVPIGVPVQPNDFIVPGTSSTPVESTVQYFDTNGALLRTVQKTYVDPQLPPDETVTLENNQQSKTHNVYASACCSSGTRSAVVTDQYSYDYGSGAPGPLLRQVHHGYASFSSTAIFPAAASVFDRPKDVITYDGTGNKMAETDYAYDGAGVSSVSSATGHDETNYGTSNNVRGNETATTVKCLQTGCSDSVSTYTYDETGQVLTRIDPCGNGTCGDMVGTNHKITYSYADTFTLLSSGQNAPCTSGCPSSGHTNAYLTKITDPLGHIVSFAYDYDTGQLTQSTDENTQSTGYIYNDPFSRPTTVNYPDGGQTEIAYNDSAPSPTVATCELINGTAGTACSPSSPATGWKTSVETKDGMGHSVQTALVSDPDGTTYVPASYDGLGREYQSYNATRCSTPTSNCGTETTWGFSTYNYDSLGRVTSVTEQDGSTTSTSYSGNCTTVTDEAGKSRKSCSDALGPLTQVFEDPSGLNYETDYAHDALGNPLAVTQKGGSSDSTQSRPRSFVYDSLSRLTSATNPESGTISYTYDNNGNLATKTAPGPNNTANAVTTYSYDALNRLLQKSYSGGNATPTVSYGYDGTVPSGCTPPTIVSPTGSGIPISPTNVQGRQSGMCDASGTAAWVYDSVGRPTIEERKLNGATKNMGYIYYLNGQTSNIYYPSGNRVQTEANAAGRQIGAIDEGNNYVFHNSTFTPSGALASFAYAPAGGGQVSTTNFYNSRLQLAAAYSFFNSDSPSFPFFFSRCYDFHLTNGGKFGDDNLTCTFPASTGDNGNVFQITNNLDTNRTQNFTYDSLNRIQQAYTSGPNWGETYTTDAWGNMTNIGQVSGKTSSELLNAAPATVQNRLTGYGYDGAGNMISNGSAAYTYDDENRITATAGFTYVYNGDGKRVIKCAGTYPSCSSGTLYWALPGSDTMTESDLSGTINAEYIYFNGMRVARRDVPSNVVHVYLNDQLGTARTMLQLVNATTATVEEDADYYPFGGEIVVSDSSTATHYKFTGKERDSESGLDNFEARYYTSSTGRFMTPDWAARPTGVPYAVFGDPQSLNLYTYVRNDPVSRADADGHAAAGNDGGCSSFGEAACAGQPIVLSDPRQVAELHSENTATQNAATKSCGFLCKLWNLIKGEGFQTDDEVTEAHRQWLLQHATNQADKDKIRHADSDKINNTYYCVQSPNCAAQFQRWVSALAGRLTSPQATDLAEYLGFRKVKVDWDAHGQPVFEKDGRYISPDADSHSGGTWKEFDRRGNRIGTLDWDLTRIGP